MHNEELQAMTVVQLRKLARESGVKLSAGIDKKGIIERLIAVQDGEAKGGASSLGEKGPQPSLEADTGPQEKQMAIEELQQAALSADVTSVQPSVPYQQPWQLSRAQSHAGQQRSPDQPVYRQAWQARPQPQRQPTWQQPKRPTGAPSRFGPQVNYVQNPPSKEEVGSRGMEATPKGTPPQSLDGYRLSYQAAPQRNHTGRYDGGRAAYKADSATQRAQYQLPIHTGREDHFNDSLYKPVRDTAFSVPYAQGQPLPDLLRAGEGVEAAGVLEILPDGYGFLRADTLLPGKGDIYTSAAQIRRYGLRTGDRVQGIARPSRTSDKFSALLYVETLNGRAAQENPTRLSFDGLTPIYPDRRILLENGQSQGNMLVRLVDLVAPIGFGQRSLIVGPPGSGSLTMLRELGKAIQQNDPKAHLMLLLVDAAPEDVTEIRDELHTDVFASTFTEAPESQTRVSETMMENAQRLVEEGQNVVILLSSLTKLTRAYQAVVTQGSRTMTNTVTPAALVRPKRFFGMARNTREAGSLTIIATITVDTGSRVDDIIFEEFKGTANMEVRLCAPHAGDPMFPMVDLQRTSTKKDDALLSNQEKEILAAIRKVLGAVDNREALAQLTDMMQKTKDNQDLFVRMKEWLELWEKSGALGKK